MIDKRKGSAVVDVVIGAAILVFIVLPVFSGIIERYILQNKAQIIKDALDMTNISAYNALNAESLGQVEVNFEYSKMESIYRSLLAKNLNLQSDLYPMPQSIAEDKVCIDSLIIYTEGLPALCPNGVSIKRPSIHSVISIPVRPSIYRELLLSIMGKKYIELKVHVDSEIPVNN